METQSDVQGNSGQVENTPKVNTGQMEDQSRPPLDNASEKDIDNEQELQTPAGNPVECLESGAIEAATQERQKNVVFSAEGEDTPDSSANSKAYLDGVDQGQEDMAGAETDTDKKEDSGESSIPKRTDENSTESVSAGSIDTAIKDDPGHIVLSTEEEKPKDPTTSANSNKYLHVMNKGQEEDVTYAGADPQKNRVIGESSVSKTTDDKGVSLGRIDTANEDDQGNVVLSTKEQKPQNLSTDTQEIVQGMDEGQEEYITNAGAETDKKEESGESSGSKIRGTHQPDNDIETGAASEEDELSGAVGGYTTSFDSDQDDTERQDTDLSGPLEGVARRAIETVKYDFILTRGQVTWMDQHEFFIKAHRLYPHTEVIVKLGLPGIHLSGPRLETLEARIMLMEMMNCIKERKFENTDLLQMQLFQAPETQQHINSILYEKQCKVSWETIGDEVFIYGDSDDVLGVAENFIKDEVSVRGFMPDQDNIPLLTSRNWQEFLDDILCQNEGLMMPVDIDADGLIKIVAITPVAKDIEERIQSFLGGPVTEQFLHLASAPARLFMKHKRDDLKAIEEGCSISFGSVGVSRYVKLQASGKMNDIKNAESQLEKMALKLAVRDHNIDNPGLMKFWMSGVGEDKLETLEERHDVTIDVVHEDEEVKSESPKEEASSFPTTEVKEDVTPHPLKEYFQSASNASELLSANGIHIHLEEGDLTQCQVDAIVCNVPPDLDLSKGQLSRAVLKAAGAGIQVQLGQKELKPGQTLATSAGQLRCKHIIHTTGCSWEQGHELARGVLKEMVLNSLELADAKQCTSIAFPPLGTGSMKVPVEVAALVFLQAVAEFSLTSSTLTDIEIVINKAPSFIEAFSREFQKVLGNTIISSPVHVPVSNPVKTPVQSPALTLRIYALNDAVLPPVVKELDRSCKAETGQQVIGGPKERELSDRIRNLSEDEASKLTTLAESFGLTVKLRRGKEWGHVRIQGLMSDVMAAAENIRGFLTQSTTAENEAPEGSSSKETTSREPGGVCNYSGLEEENTTHLKSVVDEKDTKEKSSVLPTNTSGGQIEAHSGQGNVVQSSNLQGTLASDGEAASQRNREVMCTDIKTSGENPFGADTVKDSEMGEKNMSTSNIDMEESRSLGGKLSTCADGGAVVTNKVRRDADSPVQAMKVQWEYKIRGRFSAYDPGVNQVLEKAFQTKAPSAEWTEKSEDGSTTMYVVWFSDMTERIKGAENDYVDIRRRLLD